MIPRSTRSLSLAALLLLVLVACKGPDADVRAQIDAFAAAATYKDTQALYRLHVDSRGEGVICDARFSNLFEKARASRAPQSCAAAADVAGQPPVEKDKLEDSVVLLSEILHYQCQNPKASCGEFARELFVRRAESSRLLERDIAQVIVSRVDVREEAGEATAYVDVRYLGGEKEDKITLYLVKVDDAWLFKTYPW